MKMTADELDQLIAGHYKVELTYKSINELRESIKELQDSVFNMHQLIIDKTMVEAKDLQK